MGSGGVPGAPAPEAFKVSAESVASAEAKSGFDLAVSQMMQAATHGSTAFEASPPGIEQSAHIFPHCNCLLQAQEAVEANKFEDTRGGGAYCIKCGRFGALQGWLGGGSGSNLDAWLTTTSSQVLPCCC